ncbi:MAG TPA: ABC transporter permease, partial [Vicinamibacterales bacterium]|nr:ABC transporter permease [Vicinamibacterales bacterium]
MTELRQAFRAVFKRPAFTLVAILTLALGIGANTAIFSIIDGVVLRPLPFGRPDEIVQLKERNARGGASRVSHPNFLDWRQRAGSFDGMSEYYCDTQTVLGPSEPRFAQTCVVSGVFFHVMGVGPWLGRAFAPEELQQNGVPAVIVSHRFWVTALGSNRDLAAIAVKIFGKTARVVGV